MKTIYKAVYVSVAVTVIAVLALSPPVGTNRSSPAEHSVEAIDQTTHASIGLGSREDRPASSNRLEDMSAAVYTIDETGGEIDRPAGTPATVDAQDQFTEPQGRLLKR